MTVGELMLALEMYDRNLPVELKAFCCQHTHPVKVEALYAEEKKEDATDNCDGGHQRRGHPLVRQSTGEG